MKLQNGTVATLVHSTVLLTLHRLSIHTQEYAMPSNYQLTPQVSVPTVLDELVAPCARVVSRSRGQGKP